MIVYLISCWPVEKMMLNPFVDEFQWNLDENWQTDSIIQFCYFHGRGNKTTTMMNLRIRNVIYNLDCIMENLIRCKSCNLASYEWL